MAHIFEIMATTNGQLNNIFNYYNKISNSIRKLPNIPTFLVVSVNRAIDNQPDIKTDENKAPEIDCVIKANTGDVFNPVYICVVDYIEKPVIDKVPIMVNQRDVSGPGLAYVVLLPMKIFDDASFEEVAVTLKDLYFSILDLDSNMQFKAEPAIIKFSESTQIRVTTYDITMIYAALGCAYINLKSWFQTEDGSPLESSHILNTFTDKELPEYYKKTVSASLDKYCKNIGTLRDSIGSGNLLKNVLYED